MLEALDLHGIVTRRRGLGIAATVLVAATLVGASTIGRPQPVAATNPGEHFNALAPLEFATEILTSESPSSPVTISFPSRMDSTSVAASLTVDPPTAVSLSWDDTFTVLSVRPNEAWAPGTSHTISGAA